MSSLGCPCYRPLGWMNWAPVLGLCQEPGRFTGSAYKSSFNSTSWAWEVGLTPLQKQETKRIDGGSSVASPMPKSVLP